MGIKLKDIFKIVKVGTAISKPFVPGAVGSVLDEVTKSIEDKGDPQNEGALKTMAEVNDQQTEAILALHERVRKLEQK